MFLSMTKRCKKFYFTGFCTHEKEIKGKEDEDDLISVLREAGSIGRGSWARRLSKLSDVSFTVMLGIASAAIALRHGKSLSDIQEKRGGALIVYNIYIPFS